MSDGADDAEPSAPAGRAPALVAGGPPGPNHRRNLVTAWTANAITALGMTAFLPFIPTYLRSLGVAEANLALWAGIIVAAAPLPAAFMGPIWGGLGDRIGRKPMMIRANLAIAVFVGSMGLVGGPWSLLVLRLGQGVFSGFIAPAMTLVSVSAPPDKQTRTAAQLQTAIVAGGSVGPLLGGLIADAWGHRAVFTVTAGLSLTAMLLTLAFVREPPRRELKGGGEARIDPLGLLRDVVQDVRGLLDNKALRMAMLVVFAVRFGAQLVDPVLALWVEQLDGWESGRLNSATGLVFGVYAAATLLATPLWGRLGDRYGARALFLVSSCGAAVLGLAHVFTAHVAELAVLRFAFGAALAGVVPAAFAAASHHSSVEDRGGAYGVTFSAVILARALGPVTGGAVAGGFGLPVLFVLSAVIMGGAGLAVGWKAVQERGQRKAA